MRCSCLRTAPLALAISASALAQTPEKLAAVVPALMERAGVPGLSMALIEDGRIAWIGSFGVRNAKTGDKVEDRTVFQAASLSKPVFAYAVLKLVDQGRLDLDAPLSKYVPDYVAGDDRVNRITARHVLTHRTGFPNWRPGVKPLVIHFNPGERFSYSGEGFVYLQRAVEKITGEPFDEFMSRTVFTPLGMTDSSYVWQEKYDSTAAWGHNQYGVPASRQSKPVRGRDPINGGGGPSAAATLLTTARDYARFVIAVMNGEGLKPETARRMLTPQSPVDAACSNCVGRPVTHESETIAWGLGVGLAKIGGGWTLWHWGDNGAFKAFVAASPASKRGVVMFANSSNGLMIAPDIVAAAMGAPHPAFDWIHYERYDSPRMTLYRAILERGIEDALRGAPTLDEGDMNTLGYQLLAVRKFREAIRIFEANAATHPNSANAWDSLGDAWLKGGTALAIESYRKTLELKPDNPNAVEVLKKLEGK